VQHLDSFTKEVKCCLITRGQVAIMSTLAAALTN